MDSRKELRANIEHIITDNKERFPQPYSAMDNYALQTFLKGAIDNARERVKRNYKTAIPQYYRGRTQLLLPLCISNPNAADLALVVEDHGAFYRASTCITLDMAYNNARQDWHAPIETGSNHNEADSPVVASRRFSANGNSIQCSS